MKLLFDFLPIILFFVVFKLHEDQREGILAATGVVIVATLLQVAWSWLREHKVEKMHVVVLVTVVLLGGLTLAFEDEMFIKWKPTAVNWLFALVLLGSAGVFRKNLIQLMLGAQVSLPARVWNTLNVAWSGFFIFCGAANLYVVYNFDTDTWVNFKLFGQLALTVLFIIAQVAYMSRYLGHDDDAVAASAASSPDRAPGGSRSRER